MIVNQTLSSLRVHMTVCCTAQDTAAMCLHPCEEGKTASGPILYRERMRACQKKVLPICKRGATNAKDRASKPKSTLGLLGRGRGPRLPRDPRVQRWGRGHKPVASLFTLGDYLQSISVSTEVNLSIVMLIL